MTRWFLETIAIAMLCSGFVVFILNAIQIKLLRLRWRDHWRLNLIVLLIGITGGALTLIMKGI